MTVLKYSKPERIRLKDHPEFSEKWLHDRIVEDPSILGLGELVLIERERRQDHAGRLDMLLADPDEDHRYEIEIMLGATDESHLVRCIEYWDIERRRYPGHDHCAVLVAEDITSRFLNVIQVMSGNIPLVAIQLSALKVGDQIVLDFVRVVDRASLRRDDEGGVEAPKASREYWVNKVGEQIVGLADQLLTIINAKDPKQHLNYNRYFIGLTDGARSRNFIYFRPRKSFLRVLAEVNDVNGWISRFEEAGLEATNRDDRVAVNLPPKALEPNRKLVAELLETAVAEYRK